MVLKFAWRYLVGKKSTQAIQIIAWISVLAMAIGTAALVIVLSVFNGFEGFIKGLYSDYYPEIKISAQHGKNFTWNDKQKQQLLSINDIEYISFSLEEKVMFQHEENQVIGVIKGIDIFYDSVTQFSKHIKYGKFYFDENEAITPKIVLGLGLSNKLNCNEQTALPINCYAFKKEASLNTLNPDEVYASSLFQVSGVYLLQDVIDNQYGFATLQTVQKLVEKENQFSSIEIKLKPNANTLAIKSKLQEYFTNKDFKIATRLEQNSTLYFVLKSERLAVFAILILMLIIASFNIIGSLSMLVIEKEKDIAILKTMGMDSVAIQKIFLTTGVLLSGIGAFIGCIIGYGICFLQQQFSIIKLGNADNFLIEAYPVKMLFADFFIIFFVVLIIAIIASFIPSKKASKKEILLRVK